MDDKKKNVPLMVALSIPVLMIVLTVISIYVPTIFIKPATDFMYTTGGNYCYRQMYTVSRGKVVENDIQLKKDDHCQEPPKARIFYYDVEEHTSRELNLEEAREYTLNSDQKSADGFEVVSGNSSDIFFYDGSSYYKKYLKKGAYSKRLNMKIENYYDYKFLGWIRE